MELALFTINVRQIGPSDPVYIIAEMSANHHQDFAQAVKILQAAKEAGVDAVKLQTYIPHTLTVNCQTSHFRINGTLWDGCTLYGVYGEAYAPWEWQPSRIIALGTCNSEFALLVLFRSTVCHETNRLSF